MVLSCKSICVCLPEICRYAVIIVLWVLLFVMIYRVLTLEKDYIEYDPFEILQIDPVSKLATYFMQLFVNDDIVVCNKFLVNNLQSLFNTC